MTQSIEPTPTKTFWQRVQSFFVKLVLRTTAFIVETFLTRTKIEGRENIPKEGPVIFAANHASTYDAVLMMAHLPKDTVFLGPGDFKLDPASDYVMRHYGVIYAKRGAVDTQGLRKMEKVLKNGGMLCLFPEGGTWEKTLEDVKPGAAYLSYVTQAPIVPIAYGGTYRVWEKIFGFKWPRITVKYGEIMPPVTTSGNRKTRQDELQAASYELIKRIYDMLPPEDQATYDRIAKQRYSGRLDAQGDFGLPEDLQLNGLAELVEKPNLFAPMKNRAEEALTAILKPQEFVDAGKIYAAAEALDAMFKGELAGYLEYRLGDEKSKQVDEDLAMVMELAQKAQQAGAQLRFRSQIWLVDDGEHSLEGITAESEPVLERMSG